MDATCVVTVALSIVFLLTGLWLMVRRSAASAALAETNRQLRDQLTETTRLVADMGRDLSAARTEAREDAERSRLRQTQVQVEHLSMLQKGVSDMAGVTNRQLEDMRRVVHERIVQLSGTVGEQLGSHNKVIMEVKGQLGGLAETAKNMHTLGKDIASLQDILRAPKLRGNLGELFLEEILRQVLPQGSYAMQHRLPSSERGGYVLVDAMIQLGDRIVPIDSKFPLETFQRLLDDSITDDERLRRRRLFLDVVCKHVDAIASKYIRPDAGTYDFALMYLPAENIYYEAVVRDGEGDGAKNVVSYAAQRKVIPVSPNTLYAYLLTVAYGLKGMQIERQAETMRAELAGFQKKFLAFYQVFEKVGRNLDLAQRGYDDAQRRAVRLQEHAGKITGANEALESSDDPPAGLPLSGLHGIVAQDV